MYLEEISKEIEKISKERDGMLLAYPISRLVALPPQKAMKTQKVRIGCMNKKKLIYVGVSFLFLSAIGIKVLADNTFSLLSKEEIAAKVAEEVEAIESANLLKREKAEKLAVLGQMTLIPQGFTLSLPLFEKSLQYQNNHTRAIFYSAILKPLMKLEGIMGRLKGVMPESWTQTFVETRWNGFPDTFKEPILKFLKETDKEPWTEFSQVQAFLKNDFLPEIEASIDKLDHLFSLDDHSAFTFEYYLWKPVKIALLKVDNDILSLCKGLFHSAAFAAKMVAAYDLNDFGKFQGYLSNEYSLNNIAQLLTWRELPIKWPLIVMKLRTDFKSIGILRDAELLKSAQENLSGSLHNLLHATEAIYPVERYLTEREGKTEDSDKDLGREFIIEQLRRGFKLKPQFAHVADLDGVPLIQIPYNRFISILSGLERTIDEQNIVPLFINQFNFGPIHVNQWGGKSYYDRTWEHRLTLFLAPFFKEPDPDLKDFFLPLIEEKMPKEKEASFQDIIFQLGADQWDEREKAMSAIESEFIQSPYCFGYVKSELEKQSIQNEDAEIRYRTGKLFEMINEEGCPVMFTDSTFRGVSPGKDLFHALREIFQPKGK